jgi:hypothetical protein
MSKLTAVAYYGGIPANNKNLEKPQILDYFCQGVTAAGDTAIAHTGMKEISCDVALIQGFVHEHGKSSPHLLLRKNAIELQKRNNKRSLIVDSNLFLYVNKDNPFHYLRYSFDGVFPTTGFYFDTEVDPDRWKKISRNLNLELKLWRQHGNHILICLQRNGGWSMQGVDVQRWLDETITKIRHYSDRHIVVRKHPGDKKISSQLKIKHKNVSVSIDNKLLIDDLKNAWATVVYNSSPSVASLIEGIPTFLTDHVPENSQTYGIANTELSLIENPKMPDRQQWIERLSMCHWNFEELRSGEAWQFFRKYI